ncbi:hypothetical protein IG631_04327 [Alternaria alternata]|nr:hypothetical protein IG631_04327 [Alternaria alternata]
MHSAFSWLLVTLNSYLALKIARTHLLSLTYRTENKSLSGIDPTMTTNANAGAKAENSMAWNTAPLTELPDPIPTTGVYPVTLYVANVPIATVTVQYPLNLGVLYGKGQIAKPGETKVDGALTLAYTDTPPQIVFQSAVTKANPNPSATPSLAPVAVASTTAGSSQGLAAKTTSEAAASPSASKGSSQSTNSGTGLSTGAIAGIAIGCLAAGALIAGLVLWFCWRRKRASKAQYSQADTYASASHEKGFSTNTTPLTGQRHAATPLGGGLPQPLEDKAISGDVSKISNAIKNHVQSYYHTSQVNPGLIDYDDLQALGSNLPISVGTLTTLLGNTATREIALRFIIAWVVVSKIQPSKDPSKTLLPSEVADCYQAISTGDRSFQGQASLTARWRVMTAELMQSSYVRNPFSPSDSRHASIQVTLATLDNVLQPYADTRMNNGERKRNLEELLKRAALFAFTLFSQPSAWEFEWQEEQGVTSGDLCIFPALMQVADETGQAVNPPRPFSEAVIRRLDA